MMALSWRKVLIYVTLRPIYKVELYLRYLYMRKDIVK